MNALTVVAPVGVTVRPSPEPSPEPSWAMERVARSRTFDELAQNFQSDLRRWCLSQTARVSVSVGEATTTRSRSARPSQRGRSRSVGPGV